MKKQISFPSIDQFRVIADVNRSYNFIGLDENGDAIYDPTKRKPILVFEGTVKLHGTNASVCFNDTSGLWIQSRENEITIQKDNAGFAFFVESHKENFLKLFEQIKQENNVDITTNTISIYFEWAGKGIQKKVAICELPKSAFIIGVKISPFEIEKHPAYWVDFSKLRDVDNRIYNIKDFKTYSVEIDFNMPQLVQNKIIEMTIEVEKECPIAKSFGFEGIGEGIVFSCLTDKGYLRFKSKGELHQNSKIKTLKPVDDEKINKIIEVVNEICHEWRFEQMLEQACNLNNGGTIQRSKMGDYLRLVVNDTIKEELDIISDAGLEPKDVNKYISEQARLYFFEQEKTNFGLE